MASKIVSELSKLSANLAAFDLPVHEGGQLTTSLEPVRTRPKKRAPSKVTARTTKAKSAPKPEVARPETGLSMLISAAGSIDGPAPDARVLWGREAAEPAPIGGRSKRMLDVVVAAMALVVLSPLLVAVAVLIYATMGRPIFFPQRRLGFQGRPFACFKFRTMVTDAEAALKSHLANNPDAAHEWSVRQKLQADPRITPLGRVLRRSSIDELPQLLSVLMGDMSCVGPRPIVEDEVIRYGRHWADYTKARPGLTGAWQVSGRSRVSYRRRVALDKHYVRTWSLWRDLWIMLKTIPAVLRTDDAA